MEEIVKLIKNPSWWFSAVIVAILMSLLAAFLKDILVSLVTKLKTWLSTSREQRKQKRLEEIEFLASNPDILTHEQNSCIMKLVRSAVSLLLCTLLAITLGISWGLTIAMAGLGVTPAPILNLNLDLKFIANVLLYLIEIGLLMAVLDLLTNISRMNTTISAANRLKRQRKQNDTVLPLIPLSNK